MKTLKQYLINYYGINNYRANKICIYIGANPEIKYNNLTKNKKDSLEKLLGYYKKINNSDAILNSLKNYKQQQIKNKIKINTLKGRRYKLKLPTKGQRTRSNARTAAKLNN